MQFQQDFKRRSEEEYVKDQGLIIDYDEIARKGKMSKEEALISKWYGVYQSRQPGDHMARIVIPGGRISSSQARKIAMMADKYSQGLLSITTRQAIQLHRLKLGSLPELMRDIAPDGLSTFHGCGDVTRTIAACPLAENCRYSRVNVLPHAISTMKYLTSFRDLDNLPRKFKITYSGCSANCAQPFMNCVGITAIRAVINGSAQNGFRVVIGGGMGWKAFVGKELFGFVPENSINAVCRAIALLYRDNGDRFNRTTSRLKFVVDRMGIDVCRKMVVDNLVSEGFDCSSIVNEHVEDTSELQPPSRPLTEQYPAGTDGTITVRAIVPKGEMTSQQLVRLAELSEMYGNQKLYTDNRQNISIHGVAPNDKDVLTREIRNAGFCTDGAFGLHDIVSCVGTTYCPKAVSTTHELFDLLTPVVNDTMYTGIQYRGFINITGCPNSCSPYRIADIGFRGMRIREDAGSVEGYVIVLGGSETAHGKILGEFKTVDCPEVVKILLDTFLNESGESESLGDFFNRKGMEYLKGLVKNKSDYKKAVKPVEFSTSEGLCCSPSDFRAQETSVPCQSGCPAQTNVPGYIEQIARGNSDEAYRINLEDNVLPGVLGRICARPCQSKCRHTWTDINGTVEICHLKRFSADTVTRTATVPVFYFGATGKNVAVIGAGPAGLAAARELKRLGHDVTVFEKEAQAGGMLIDGIPRFRLPVEIVNSEVRLIINTGITLLSKTTVDKNLMNGIVARYDAVLVATGTVKPNTVSLQNMEKEHFISGLEFMKLYNNGKLSSVSGDIVILGGGFTAVDSARACARAARKLIGEAGSVTIVYRRTEQYMAADLVEREELQRENITVKTLLNPVGVTITHGKMTGLIVRKNYLGTIKDAGKPEINEIAESDFELPCNYLIQAIGQTQDYSLLPDGVSVLDQYRTTHDKIFAAGDFLNGSLNVIRSIADGKEAAVVIDTFLMGKRRINTFIQVEKANNNGETGRSRQHDLQELLSMPSLAIDKRCPDDPEVETGYDKKLSQLHATRCYFCHYTFEIDPEKCILCRWCIDVSPRNCIKQISHFEYDNNGVIAMAHQADSIEKTTVVWIDSKNCIRCGKCLRVCPTSAISMKKTTIVNKCDN